MVFLNVVRFKYFLNKFGETLLQWNGNHFMFKFWIYASSRLTINADREHMTSFESRLPRACSPVEYFHIDRQFLFRHKHELQTVYVTI